MIESRRQFLKDLFGIASAAVVFPNLLHLPGYLENFADQVDQKKNEKREKPVALDGLNGELFIPGYESVKPFDNFPLTPEIKQMAMEASNFFGVNYKIIIAILVAEGGGNTYEGAGDVISADNQIRLLNNRDEFGDATEDVPTLRFVKPKTFVTGPGQISNGDWDKFGTAIQYFNPDFVDKKNINLNPYNLRAVVHTIAFKVKTEGMVFRDTKNDPKYYRSSSKEQDEIKQKYVNHYYRLVLHANWDRSQPSTKKQVVRRVIIEPPVDLSYLLDGLERYFGNSSKKNPRFMVDGQMDTYNEFGAAYVKGKEAPPLEIF